jgi:HK97 gp10 family phage protein
MAAGTHAKVTGLANVRRKLARVYILSNADIDWALPEIGQVVADDAKAHLTPGHGYDTGKLAGSLTVGPIERKGNVKFVKVGPTKEGWYGRFIEFGTRLLAAIPFLRPARDRNAGTFKTRMRVRQREALKHV